jgi:hypothetical protein
MAGFALLADRNTIVADGKENIQINSNQYSIKKGLTAHMVMSILQKTPM